MELSEVLERVVQASAVDTDALQQISDAAASENKIPKIVHFCFLDYQNMPDLQLGCLKTWFETMGPDWTFVNWTPAISPVEHEFERYAVDNNKFAFYADYMRCHKVLQYGGFYMDCDVTLYRDPADVLDFDYVFDREFERNFMECAAFMSKRGNRFLEIICGAYDAQPYSAYEENPHKFLCGPFWLGALNRAGVSVALSTTNDLGEYKDFVNNGRPSTLCCLDSMFLCCAQRGTTWRADQPVPNENAICSHGFAGSWTY
jgi:hypothetical protein